MNSKKTITILLSQLILMLNSCNYFIMKSGDLDIKSTIVEIPFEERLGLPVINVHINGISYDFLFDTGATNVISKELCELLNLQPLAIQGVRDSQKKKSVLKLVKLDTIQIGECHFFNTGAIVADFKKSTHINCLNIDGIIGSNLMSLAVWEIDPKNKKIKVTNSLDNLDIPEDATKIKFKSDIYKGQYIDVKLNNKKLKNLTFDTGSNGYITYSKIKYNRLIKSNLITDLNKGFGSGSSGLFGPGKPDSIYYATSNFASVGNLQIENPLIEFSNKLSNTIGMEFIRNYRTILNWDSQSILMIKNNNNIIPIKTFGFTYLLDSNK